MILVYQLANFVVKQYIKYKCQYTCVRYYTSQAMHYTIGYKMPLIPFKITTNHNENMP